MDLRERVEFEVEMRSPAEKVWEIIIRDSTDSYPNRVMPDYYESIQLLHGDGKSPGSLRLLNYKPGCPLKFLKQRIDVVDEESKSYSYTIVDWSLVDWYKSLQGRVDVVAKGEGRSVVKWTGIFEKTSQDAPHPTMIRDFSLQHFHSIDAYLVAQDSIPL